MKRLLIIPASVLLLFNGIGALYGGYNLMMYPDGSSIQLTPDWLKHTPFTNYFIPGLVLFIFNGLFSMVAFVALFFNHRINPWLIMAQGAILVGWIVIQMLLLQTVYYLHIILGGTGIALLILGYLFLKKNRTKTSV
ncbi:MAG: hypothetical protein WAR80_04965 [Ferruginibacter sp.]